MKDRFADSELPPFLYGTFDWLMNGLHFESEPPVDLLSSAALSHANPWFVLAAVLQRAKVGNHKAVRRLAEFFNLDEPFALGRVSLLLAGDMASEGDLRILEEVLQSDDADARVGAAQACVLAGRLWLVPRMLEAWHRAQRLAHRESIGYAISDLLETGECPIAQQASIYNLQISPPPPTVSLELRRFYEQRLAEPPEPELFPQLVQAAYDQLVEQFKTDQVTVWQGKLFDVIEFAREFLSEIRTMVPGSCIIYRHKFEASTGVDCRRFFVDLEPQRLEMAATLEEFLASDMVKQFEPGVRYFFGHRIPD